MEWETPTFEEIRMDAEIGSYQSETDKLEDEAEEE
jgi:coenzyme PQQ precursor peptide PqqA